MKTEQNKTGLFSDLQISDKILSILSQKGFEVPTPIQQKIIPAGIQGKDIIGIAQTGTGKTLAFGIPMLQRLCQKKGQGLILVPTRELALQVDKALKQIGSSLKLTTAVVIGGVAIGPQKKAVRNNPDFVIATPGRLVDLIKQGAYRLDKISIITLDEADRMLDVGFLPQIKKILHDAPKGKQVMLFSATMPKTIASLSAAFMKNPEKAEIAPQGTSSKNIKQELYYIKKGDKMRLLDHLLDENREHTTLVFSRTKHGAKRMARQIRAMGHTATEIHGNKSQAQRKAALDGFTNRRFRVMVATDIAARGIDVKHISLVVNYDLPENCEDYVHRIGRTGRAGRSGTAISFATHDQKRDVKKIERLTRKSLAITGLPVLPPARPKALEEIKRPHRRSGGRPSSGGRRNNFSRNKRSRSPRGAQNGGNRNNRRREHKSKASE